MQQPTSGSWISSDPTVQITLEVALELSPRARAPLQLRLLDSPYPHALDTVHPRRPRGETTGDQAETIHGH
ncbi:hypothetical protein V6N13_009306 [Hibiscus sabdariffa]